MCDVCVVVYLSLRLRDACPKRFFSEEDEKIEKWITRKQSKDVDFDDRCCLSLVFLVSFREKRAFAEI